MRNQLTDEEGNKRRSRLYENKNLKGGGSGEEAGG